MVPSWGRVRSTNQLQISSSSWENTSDLCCSRRELCGSWWDKHKKTHVLRLWPRWRLKNSLKWYFKKEEKSGLCQTSGSNNIANDLWKPSLLLIKLKMPLSSFLVVPAELNNYCFSTILCSARAEANSHPRVSPKQAALILGEEGLPLVNENWLKHIKNTAKNFPPHVQLNSVTANQKDWKVFPTSCLNCYKNPNKIMQAY